MLGMEAISGVIWSKTLLSRYKKKGDRIGAQTSPDLKSSQISAASLGIGTIHTARHFGPELCFLVNVLSLWLNLSVVIILLK